MCEHCQIPPYPKQKKAKAKKTLAETMAKRKRQHGCGVQWVGLAQHKTLWYLAPEQLSGTETHDDPPSPTSLPYGFIAKISK